MQYSANVTPSNLFKTSVDGQRGQSVSDFRFEQSVAADTHHHGNPNPASCQAPLSPGDGFDTLQSAALSAGFFTDQSSNPEQASDRGIKRRGIDHDVDRYVATQKGFRNTLGTCCKYDLSSDPGFDGDVEDDLYLSDEEDDSSFFSQRPSYGWKDNKEDARTEPPPKKVKYSFAVDDNDYDTLDLEEGLSKDVSDNESEHTLDLEEDLRLSDDENTNVDSGIGTNEEFTDEESSDSDTCADSESTDSNTDDASSDWDSSDGSSGSESESEYSENTDDSEDEECPNACPCQGCQTGLLPLIGRAMRVSVPLYKKLLQSRLMQSSNRLQYVCCERYCSFRWPIRRSHDLLEDYAHSDLQMEHFSWGTWKEEEPTCPESCVCKSEGSINVQKIERRFDVAAPLYKTLLAYRAMVDSNREGYVCCGKFCCYSWRKVEADELVDEYSETDVEVDEVEDTRFGEEDEISEDCVEAEFDSYDD